MLIVVMTIQCEQFVNNKTERGQGNMAISLGSGCSITLYYILDPIYSQQRARDHSKLQEKVVAKVISVLAQQKKNIVTID